MMTIQNQRRWTRTVVSAMVLALASAVVGAPAAAAPKPDPEREAAVSVPTKKPGVRLAPDERDDLRFPGLDTIALPDGSQGYISYGASARGRKVPFTIHGKGADASVNARIDGDALPHGGGKWTNGKGIWAPGAFVHTKDGVRRYYLFYTAGNRETPSRKCIGVATSTHPTKGFVAADRPLVCPTKGKRWALDADVVRGPEGAVWLLWRDGQRAIGPESALSVMMISFTKAGAVRGETAPKVLLRSNNLPWTKYRDGGVTVLENPSAFYVNGSWYLMYSGNSWNTDNYATGIAYCGAKLADNACTPMPGPRRAYFAYRGKNGLPSDMVLKGLPGNKRGPGAMQVFRAHDGKLWVGWNYIVDNAKKAEVRLSRTAPLVVTGKGAKAQFQVVAPPRAQICAVDPDGQESCSSGAHIGHVLPKAMTMRAAIR